MRRFKNVIMIIIAGICILFVFNIIYLTGLFHSIEADTERVISLCVEEADNKEMQIRLNSLSDPLRETHSISISKSFRTGSVSSADTLQTTIRSIIDNNDTETKTRSEKLNPGPSVIGQFPNEIRTIIHQNVDVILPVNLQKLDSLLIAELKNKGIYREIYYTEITDRKTGTSLRSSREELSGIPVGDYSFSYTYDDENKYAYKIHMASLTGVVFRQMSGILTSTFLIIVLLGIAFWYLIKTVMQQKTLEKMKDDFTNNMTHELKTPIAVAYSAVDALLNFRQGDSREKRKKYLQVCVDQLSHLSGLVEQILSMSLERRKSIILNPDYIEIKTVVNQLIALHNLKSDREVVFHVDITPEDMTVYADGVHLNNIVSNLLDNAIKYSEGTATITITACREKAYSVLKVKDQGIGIAPGNIEHVFDKFYRVPNGNLHNVKGYGLGLFYVRQIVEKHNGSVSVKSNVNKGSVFTVKLP
ncbi:MAG: HAMP domain-containing histidine kinase, partial [Tannerellaceae bacterium]|nr:HAMP domain-containing histidine kinase [Tannerellaceae bacterium]